jgi:hypothetical protein
MFQLFESVKSEADKENLRLVNEIKSDSIIINDISINTPNGETIVPHLSLKVYNFVR